MRESRVRWKLSRTVWREEWRNTYVARYKSALCSYSILADVDEYDTRRVGETPAGEISK